jgi:hypothetical protein
VDEVPSQGASALDSLGGDTVMTTSATVDRGPAHPLNGETSHELRHDGHRTRKHQRAGLEGVGSDGLPRDRDIEQEVVDEQKLPTQTK